MHAQIVTFRLNGLTERDYTAHCAEVAPAFAAIPGLGAKLWLADRARGVYGGLYLFDDETASRAYAGSELFATVSSTPGLADVQARDFAVLEEPTRSTQPRISVVSMRGGEGA